ncbi:MAG: metallophosphoesterase [Candidatus Bathyarchaeia archaeon]|jgi:protein phosphatase
MFFSSFFVKSTEVQGSQFLELIDDAVNRLKLETGKMGSFVVDNRLVKLDSTCEVLVVGDLHGDLASLKTILETSGFVAKMEKSPDACMVFLGDYVDRGPYSAEVLYVLLSLKLAFPQQVILLRGNHEGPKDLLAYPHDLPMQLQYRFPHNWQLIYERLFQLFDQLYLGVYVEKQFLLVHGGVSPKIHNLNDITQAGSNPELLADLLWSDPDDDVENVAASPRGIGVVFGEKVTRQVLDAVDAKILIRGHEASSEGFKINHGGRVLTLFSRKGQPYFNRYGAYLCLPLQRIFENAYPLEDFVFQF